MDIAAYYADLTRNYLLYSGESNGWHFGVWEDDVENVQQSLIRSNEMLLRGLGVGSSTRVLDAGCGNGGFAVWAAQNFGCHVTGITITEEHIAMADELAASKGVAALCDFRVMDMDRMGFEDESFDIVTNQETMCHSADKRAFLEGVQRVLKPGGSWRAIDYLIQEEPFTAEQEAAYRDLQNGWHIPFISRKSEVKALLEELGFDEIGITNISDLVEPCARMILRQCRLPALATRLHIDWLVYSFNRRKRENRRGHISGAVAYCEGLLGGHIMHNCFSATKRGNRS